ncbi:MAG: type II secretion system protein GspK [bacterium]|nr:type II secretion system protein GspK [bacterium]
MKRKRSSRGPRSRPPPDPAARARRRGEEGLALLLSLFVIALFSVVVLEFNYSTRVEHRLAAGSRDEFLALEIARAGVAEAIALLREDRLREIEEKAREDEASGRPAAPPVPTPTPKPGTQRDIGHPDHYGEPWAEELVMAPFGAGFLSRRVIDESGKININTLVKEQRPPQAIPRRAAGEEETAGEEAAAAEQERPPPRAWGQTDETAGEEAEEGEERPPPPVRYTVDKKVEKDIMRLLETLDVRGVDPEKVTAAIVDWMDSDDDGDWEEAARRGDADRSPPKNAPLDVLSELLMVEGVTGDLYYGPGVPEFAFLGEEAQARGRRRGGVGLRDCLTVHTKAKVNVNTAPPEVLTALLEEENESLVREIASYTQRRHFTDLDHFSQEMGEHVPASFRAAIGVGSDSFQIVSEGRVGEARRQIRASVYRDDDGNVKILEWSVMP